MADKREFSPSFYCFPDGRNDVIARMDASITLLKRLLDERDDLIASLTELIRCEFGLIAKTAREVER